VATFDYRSTALGYLNPERLLDRVFATKGLAPAFLDHLGWPARLPKERPGQVEALEKQLTHLTATDDRFRGVAIEHVLVVELYEFLKDREAQLAAMFLSTRDEKGLRAPFRARYLDRNKECMALHDEVAIGKSRVDVLGVIRKTILGFSAGEVYAAYELKARYAEVKRALEQLSDYQAACEETYLVATPLLAIEYALRSAPRRGDPLDPRCLESKLKALGAGLYLLYSENGEHTLECEFASVVKTARWSAAARAALVETLRRK
jgi:hypothetical protein